MVPKAPFGIGEVDRRPEVVRERAPHAVVAVDCDRELDALATRVLADVVDVVLEADLRGMDADDRQAGAGVLRGPGPDIGGSEAPLDSRIGAEVDDAHVTAPHTRI